MGKSECILIIDGEYIYITSNENKFLKKVKKKKIFNKINKY